MTLSGLGYMCSRGESFDMIALIIYGDEKYAAELICANPEHGGKLVFEGGENLYLPVIEMDEADATNTPTTAPWKE